jgi:hypothetical protein
VRSGSPGAAISNIAAGPDNNRNEPPITYPVSFMPNSFSRAVEDQLGCKQFVFQRYMLSLPQLAGKQLYQLFKTEGLL